MPASLRSGYPGPCSSEQVDGYPRNRWTNVFGTPGRMRRNTQTGERFTGEVLFTTLYRRQQDEILADGGNWRRHLEYVERSKATNQTMRDIIRELKMATDAGTLASHKPESEQERAIKDPESYALAKKILKEVFEENKAI